MMLLNMKEENIRLSFKLRPVGFSKNEILNFELLFL